MKHLIAILVLLVASFASAQTPRHVDVITSDEASNLIDGVSVCFTTTDYKTFVLEENATWYCDFEATPDPVWRQVAPSGGDVNSSETSSTDTAITCFDGTTGKIVKECGNSSAESPTVDGATGAVTIKSDLTIDGNTLTVTSGDSRVGGKSTAALFYAGRGGVVNSGAHKPIVVLTFDDGHETQYDDAWTVMKARYLPGTFCIPTNLWGVATPYPGVRMLETEAITMANEGADIQSHGDEELTYSSACPESGEQPNGDCSALHTDWSLNREWFKANLDYYPDGYCVPQSTSTFYHNMVASGSFSWSRTQTTGMQNEDGLHVGWDGPPRYAITGYFPGSTEDMANICGFIDNAVVPDDSALYVLGFHMIDPTNSISNANVVHLDEFVELLDCLEDLRDDGEIDVLTMSDALSRRKIHQGRWNLLANPGLGDPSGSTTDATLWSNFGTGLALQASTQNSPKRELVMTQQTTGKNLAQNVNGLIPGKSYIVAADIEWVSADATRGFRYEILSMNNTGANRTGIIRSNGWDSGPGTVNDIETHYLRFTPNTPFVQIKWSFQGAATPAQDWILRNPRVFREDSIGGSDEFSVKMEHPALLTFRTDAGTVSGVTAGEQNQRIDLQPMFADLDFSIPNIDGAASSIGPSRFLITLVEISSDQAYQDGYDWHIDGQDDGGGTDYCGETGLQVAAAYRIPCYAEDNDSLAVNDQTSSGGTVGNEIHIEIDDQRSAGSAAVYTVTLEGIIVQ